MLLLLKRLTWNLLWNTTIRPFPRRSVSKWEILILKMFGAQIGKGCDIYSSVRIYFPWNLIIGDKVQIAEYVVIQNESPLIIKNNSVISQYTYLNDGTHSTINHQDEGVSKSIIIEEECWVSVGCFVGIGVKIGRGTLVGSRTVLKKSTPPYSIVMGNPSKITGFRYTPEEIIIHEKELYSEKERNSEMYLKKNYEKYYLNRMKEINEFTKL